ncbi:DUF5324 family protein [Kitasatospora sp. NPDC101176]|uniref:DUF5324 family protein n=1 Tax=Kitasatospora sp. NPDC101176 TaxID=3364099 RepID=UPI003819BEB9
MTFSDSARETATKTRDTAAQFADGARQRLGPAMDALGPKAAQAAQGLRVQYDRHLAPQFGHLFASLPPEAQKSTLKALHRAQEAALAARLSAAHAADQARSTVGPRVAQAVEDARAVVVPVAQEAQTRGAAAFTALQGNVTSAEISDLAARNARRRHRNRCATGLAVAGAVAVGSGVLVWQWWRRHSNPEWLVEPPTGAAGRPAGAHAAGGAAPAGVTAADAANGPAVTPPAAGTGTGTGDAEPGPPPGRPAEDDRPKPHDPRKHH